MFVYLRGYQTAQCYIRTSRRGMAVVPKTNSRLIVKDGPSSGLEFELTQPQVVIGRDLKADLVIASPAVSRRHARLILEGNSYALEDLGSSNGTFLNNQKLRKRTLLKSGDVIRLGHVATLVFQAPHPVLETVLAKPKSESPSIAETLLSEDAGLSEISNPPQFQVTIAGKESREYTLYGKDMTIGRAGDNDIVIPSQIVSRHHARLEYADGVYRFVVLPEAGNPVLFEGRPLTAPLRLRHDDNLRIGSQDPGMMVTLSYQSPSEAVRNQAQTIVFGEKTTIQIGRDDSNDVVLTAPQVSRFHVQVERIGQRYRIRDLRSSNGTFVNNQQIEGDVWLKPSDTLRVGPYRFVLGEDHLAQYDESSGLKVEAFGLNKWVRKDLNILKDISVIFFPREFVVVVGQSGGGKSTLVDAIAGYRPATHGRVLVNGIDVYRNFNAIRNEIGYVPQRDIIHAELTVYQALDYAAQLRMTPDTTRQERHQRVMEVLADLDLLHRKDVQISGLSGGQQKRVSIGVELLTKPGLFFLDEPTSGLDPGTETALMQLMRRLADQGRTIVLITHATKNVMLADKVIFLARGGYLAWFGPPEEALKYFDQYRSERDRRASEIEFDEIYAILENQDLGKPEDWAERYRQSPAYEKYILQHLEDKIKAPNDIVQSPTLVSSRPHRQVSSLRQFMILSARNLKILTRDRFGLALMLATAPLVGLLDVLLAVLLGRNPFDPVGGSVTNVIITLFLLAMYGVMVGGISQMREIVKERDIYKRERLVNLKILPYVMSKIWIAALLAFYQAAAYTIIHFLAFNMPGGLAEFILFFITLTLATMAGMMLGLFASALSPNSNSAPLFVILLMLPQIVLGGALVPLPRFVSAPTATHWAFNAFMVISGVGSDVAADVCWALPEEARSAMTLDEKNANCRCMGINVLDPASCRYPGLGEFYNPAIESSPPVAPTPIGDPPPEPDIPKRPDQPENQSDTVAMAQFLQALQTWETQVKQIQANYKSELATYQANAEVYKAEAITYQEDLAKWQIARAAAVEPAEGLIKQARNKFGWTFVDKNDLADYSSSIATAWVSEVIIITVLFVGILWFQKRKDKF